MLSSLDFLQVFDDFIFRISLHNNIGNINLHARGRLHFELLLCLLAFLWAGDFSGSFSFLLDTWKQCLDL